MNSLPDARPELPARTDVLVVGAGPVGLTLATALVRRGVDTVLVDKDPEGANTSRAPALHSRTLEVLRELDVSDELVKRGVTAPRFIVRDRDRTLLTIPFGKLPTDFPFALMVPQDITEKVLLDRLHAAGGAVHRPCRIAGIEQEPDGAVAKAEDGRTIRARYLVGTDGMYSTVREHTGIPFTGDTYAQTFFLSDVRLEWNGPSDAVVLFFDANGLAVVVPLPDGLHRVVVTVDKAPEKPTIADIQALLDARGPRSHRAVVTELVWSSRFRVHHRLADRFRAGRLFLAGDAAHVHSPAGGQGMNTGIQDGLSLGAKLAAVLRDGAPESTLDSYERERRPVAEEVVAFTHRMTRVATVGSPLLRRVRNNVLFAVGHNPLVRRTMALRLSGLAGRKE